MKIVPILESEYPLIIEWGNKNPSLMDIWQEAGETFDYSKESENYVLKINDVISGLFSLFNIVPGESGEFGVTIFNSCGSVMAYRAIIKYLNEAFKRWDLKKIYITPVTEKSRIGAEFIGFRDNYITIDVLERKWCKWLN